MPSPAARQPTQRRIPAVYMRGGTSKGVFLQPGDLPADPQQRDALLLRIMGSPDPYAKQIDGMGGASSSTSKIVLVSPSTRADCDVDYRFGQVAIDRAQIDWSGNCGNLTAAVGPYAIAQGMIEAPRDGLACVRIWQSNIGKIILAHVPMQDGQVVELGDFELDGVTFPAAQIQLEFLDPGAGEAMFPTGRPLNTLDIPGLGQFELTLINAGNPTIFIAAASLGLRGDELPAEINAQADLLTRCEAIRAHGAVAMGLAASAAQASAARPHTPKLALIAPPAAYQAASGKTVAAADIDLLVRILSMGQLHHAMTGTAAVAIAAAAAIPDTLLSRMLGGVRTELCFGHPSGTLKVGAQARRQDKAWRIDNVVLNRSARRLMEGWVLAPAP